MNLLSRNVEMQSLHQMLNKNLKNEILSLVESSKNLHLKFMTNNYLMVTVELEFENVNK